MSINLTISTVKYGLGHDKLAAKVTYSPIAFCTIQNERACLEEVAYLIQHTKVGVHLEMVDHDGNIWAYTRTSGTRYQPPRGV